MKSIVISNVPKCYKATIPISQIVLIWLIISTNAFNHFTSNEVDVLPSAKQFVEHSWLPNDWYLNLDISYRQPFDVILGFIVSRLGFQYGAYLGRLLLYFLLALAVYAFWRAFRLRFSLGLVALFIFLNRQSLIAGEWIVGGVETKTISYAFVILSCASFFRKQYLAGFAFTGAAMSFHPLVGLYAMFCAAVAMVLTGVWQLEWQILIEHSWPFFITGLWGIQAAIRQLLPQGDIDTAKAWEIYVGYRVSHHVLPVVWSGSFWIGALALATCLFLVIYFIKRSCTTHFIAAYALGGVSLFLVGLSIYLSGQWSLLRFYWFRFPDVMIPFLSAVMGALVLNNLIDMQLLPRLLHGKHGYRVQAMLSRGAPLVFTLIVMLITFWSIYRLRVELKNLEGDRTEMRPMFKWVAENTSRQSIFLVDPTIPDFYIYAQRARFVSFKHLPQSPADILEWYKRLVLCNGNRLPQERGFKTLEELQTNFYKLDEASIRQIAVSYGIHYYLGRPEQLLQFERVYSTSHFTLYEIR